MFSASRCLILALTWALLATQAAWAQAQPPKRVALVIGNANYLSKPLRNPVNDAADLSAALQRMGFEVMERKNRSADELRRDLADFQDKLSPGAVGLFYFAGHGVQAGRGLNYLLPVGVEYRRERDAELYGLEAGTVLRRMEESGAALSLVILDACRDSPLPAEGRSTASRGLGRMEAPSGSLIAFATAPGSTADENTAGRNGLYTQHLLAAIETPGLRLEDVFKRVRRAVERDSNRRQSPEEISKLTSDEPFYFRPVARAGNPNASVAPEPVVPPALPGQGGGLSLDDLKKEEAARQQWSQWQARMKADFDAAAGFSGSADLQTKAWERFLAAWGQDNPHSQDDESLRQQAQERLKQAQVRTQQEPQRLAQQSPIPQSSTPQSSTPQAGGTQTFIVKGVSFQMVNIPAGSFVMGSPENELGSGPGERPQRRVTVQAFQLGQTEVTQGLWQAVMGSNPSHFKSCGRDCPVEQVSWDDAQAFIQRLNQQTGQHFRLPSEAEWEYAARAGCTTPFNVSGQCRSKIEPREANFNGTASYNGSAKGVHRKATTRVGSFAVNGWGLSDMHGNVWEWVQDCHSDYNYAPSNGAARELPNCGARALRGGSWYMEPQWVRSAYRIGTSGGGRDIGFRIAKTSF